jgi:hypothetical protein
VLLALSFDHALGIATAAGTIAAVIVALGIAWLWPWLNRPRLIIEFEPVEPYSRATRDLPDLIPSRWVRVRVKNVGRDVAKQCTGKLVAVLDANGKQRNDRDSIQLMWAGVVVGHELDPIDLCRQDSQFLGVVTATERDTQARFVTDQAPRGFPQTLEPLVEHRITVAAYATNANPAIAHFDVYFVGFTTDLRMTRAS